jgi:hypothetical protein
MVGCGYAVICPKLFQKVSECLINEVRPSFTYDHSRCSEAREDYFVKHLSSTLGISSSAW